MSIKSQNLIVNVAGVTLYISYETLGFFLLGYKANLTGYLLVELLNVSVFYNSVYLLFPLLENALTYWKIIRFLKNKIVRLNAKLSAINENEKYISGLLGR
ncbi:MAG: hypothetical protein PW786_05075 [Arachidicoccus sp.]|nr:hypothetical protein [Arachidicoccus sp.]